MAINYYITYKDINLQNEYKLEIISTTGTTTPQLIECGEFPIVVKYPEISNKFTVFHSSSADLQLLSQTNMQFSNLFTADMQGIKVNHYVKTAGNWVPNWIGFLDSELYHERFEEKEDYVIEHSANDGFNLLERLNYVDANGNPYSGILTQWQVLKNCISKLNLNYNSILVACSTSISGVTISSSETIFHKTYAIQSNYYDEDNQPFSCRKVIEAILEPYGLYIQQINADLVICDINTLAQDSAQNFKKFDLNFNYVTTVSKNLNLGDIYTQLGIDNNNSLSNTKETAINRQKLVYSPYRLQQIVNYEPSKDDFKTITSSVQHSGGITGWYEHFFQISHTWNSSNKGYFCRLNGLMQPNLDVEEYYLKLDKITGGTTTDNYNGLPLDSSTLCLKYKLPLPHILASNQYYLKFGINAMFRTKEKLNDSAENGYKFYEGFIHCRLKIGTKKFIFRHSDYGLNYDKGSWQDLTHTKDFQVPFYRWQGFNNNQTTHEYINDKYLEFKISKLYGSSIEYEDLLIPLAGIQGDVLEFEIYSWDVGEYGVIKPSFKANIKDVRINKISFEIVDKDGNPVSIDEDIEYNAYLNPKFKNEGEVINLFHGTNFKKISTERAGLMQYNGTNYEFIQAWIRENKTDLIENLLLRSLVSNYTYPSEKITICLEYQPSILGYITYQNQLPNKKFMVQGAKINYKDAYIDLSLIEISKDNLDIITTG